MSFSTYGGLKTAVADWLDRADLTARIPDFVSLATVTLNKVLRTRRMTTTATVAMVAGTRYSTGPTDMIEPLFVTLTDEDNPLEQVSPQQLVALRRFRFRAQGIPRFFALLGGRIEFVPTPLASGSIDFAYYQAIPALVADGDSNWVLTHEPDIYLYASLLHAAQFLHDAAAVQRYEALLTQAIGGANSTADNTQMDGKAAGASTRSPIPSRRYRYDLRRPAGSCAVVRQPAGDRTGSLCLHRHGGG